MKDLENANYALLSQKEIDTLVRFLTDQKSLLPRNVMDQESIDKLISLIRNDRRHILGDLLDPFTNVSSNLLVSLKLREDIQDVCELRVTTNADTGYLILTAVNSSTGKELVITPKHLDKTDSEAWGYSMSPLLFNRLARSLSLRYTQETHDTICTMYAKHMFGSEDYLLPVLYLPTNSDLLESLL